MVVVTAESWDPRAGGRLRGALVFVPGFTFCFAYVAYLLVLTLVAPAFVQRRRHALVRPWGNTLLWIMGIRIEGHGLEHLASAGPAIVTFNHQSLLDLMLLTSIWPENTTVLYKQEFHSVPLFGTVMRRMGMIPVDRGQREAAIRSLSAAGQRLALEGTKVFIAPEGTRSRTDGLLPFKRGPIHLAVETGMPIIPVIFRGVRSLWPQGELIPRPGVARADVLPPIDTTGWTFETLHERMQELRALYLEYVPGATQAQPRRRPRKGTEQD